MKVIFPVAGMGTRLRPHTYVRPKPLFELAGKTVLAHIVDELAGLPIEEFIFIVGQQGDQIADYFARAYPNYAARYIKQEEMRGQSHAIKLAAPYVEEDALIIFPDTIFDIELSRLATADSDVVLQLKAVDDPSTFGVAVLGEDGLVSQLVEKPQSYVSNLVVVGVYYFKNAKRLFQAIEQQMALNLQLKGEYFLADAMSIMLAEGAKFRAYKVRAWEDTGTIANLLQTNRYLLAKNFGQADVAGFDSCVIIPPVYIAPDAKLERCVIGPYVSIAGGAKLQDAIVRNAIIGRAAELTATLVSDTVIGERARISGSFKRLNVADDSQIAILD